MFLKDDGYSVPLFFVLLSSMAERRTVALGSSILNKPGLPSTPVREYYMITVSV